MEQFRAEERPLPPVFDHRYLVDAFEVSSPALSVLLLLIKPSLTAYYQLILSTEHHQLLLKMLMFLYAYAAVFMGEARVALYNDFILDRHFYYFFLHWDINVRNVRHLTLSSAFCIPYLLAGYGAGLSPAAGVQGVADQAVRPARPGPARERAGQCGRFFAHPAAIPSADTLRSHRSRTRP